MDDSLYDTSWILYSLPSLSTSLRTLLTSSASTSQSPRTRSSALDKHAEAFHNSLVDRERPRYEDEEEKQKLGGLRACTWTRLAVGGREEGEPIRKQKQKQKRKRDDTAGDDDDSAITLERGLLVSLVYDKTTYKFAILSPKQHGSSNKRTRLSTSSSSSRTVDREDNVAIILAKASPAVFKAFQTYLTDTFSIQDIHPLKLPPTFLQSTLANYISSICTVLSQTTSERQLPLDMKAIFGMIKLSISFSAPIAPSLKMLDVEVPSESVLTAFNGMDKGKDDHNDSSRDQRQQLLQDTTAKNVLEMLSKWIHERTGLKLPISEEEERSKDSSSSDHTSTEPTNLDATSTADTKPEPPMRISRILSAAYAISTEGRLKFALKSAETCDSAGGHATSGDSNHQDPDPDPDPAANVVRKANEALLVAAMVEARRQIREDA